MNLVFLDTGAMYRSVSVICLEKGISLDDTEAIIKEAREIQITFGNSPEGQTVFANGHNVTQAIRTPEIDACVSRVAAIPEVREAMVVLQRRAGEAGDVVAEGRDIGTVVFPKAEVKVFLTADPEARAHRRAVQREGKDTATNASATADAAEEKKILEDIKARDEADSSRKVAPLKPAPDAHHIDSSHMTLNEVVDAVVALHPVFRNEIGTHHVLLATKARMNQKRPPQTIVSLTDRLIRREKVRAKKRAGIRNLRHLEVTRVMITLTRGS